MLQTFVFDWDILVLVQKVINLELEFRKCDIFSAELIFKFDQFVLKLNT